MRIHHDDTAIGHRPRRYRWLTLVTLCIAVLIAQVDTSVVNLAVRTIGQNLNANADELQWVVDSYNLFYAALLLTGGLLADLYGRRRLFIAGTIIFTSASILCALSPSVLILIGGRAIAGLGAALLLPACLAIIRVAWPDPKERGKALGIWAACNGLALAIGSTLGGVLIGAFGWRSIFLLAVPLGIAILILTPLSISESSAPHGRHFDAGGQVLGAAVLGGIAVAAIEMQRFPFLGIVALGGAAFALALFIKVEATGGAAALVHLDMFKVQKFRGAMASTSAMTFGMYGVLFLLPLMWQNENILSAEGVGIALIPMALIFTLTSPFSGALSARLGTRITIGSGMASIGCGLALIALTARNVSIFTTEIGLALTGLGMGLATGPLMGAAIGAVPAARSGSAAALINVARMVGATLGVAILGSVFAVVRGGPDGLRWSMFLAAALQITAAIVSWRTIPPDEALKR